MNILCTDTFSKNKMLDIIGNSYVRKHCTKCLPNNTV